MSTQLLQMPGEAIIHRNGRRIIVAASIVAALFAGGLVGRSTAPSASSRAGLTSTVLPVIGPSSLADSGRAEMFQALNGLRSTATAPITQLVPRVVPSESSERRAEMFRAMNGLRRQQI